jgi:hypothetical protein
MKWNYIIGGFCEKKIWGSHPEWLNCISSFFISFIPYIGLRYSKFYSKKIKSILSLLFIGGFTAFLYHWNGYYISKHLDEAPMILSIWLGLKKILSINRLNMFFYYILNVYFVILLSINSIPNFNNYFPILFTIPCILLIPLLLRYYLYLKHSCKNNNIRIGRYICFKGMLFSLSGACAWGLSETYCHPLMIFGHSYWHIFFTLGMFYIMTSIDYLEQSIKNINVHIEYYYKIPILK